MDPQVAGSIVMALGGVALAALGVLALRIARGPMLQTSRVEGIDQRVTEESRRVSGELQELRDVMVEVRRLALKRDVRKDRRSVAPEEEETAPAALAPPGVPPIVFKPGCDAMGRPVTLEAAGAVLRRGSGANGNAADPGEALARRGLRVVDGQLEEAAG